MIERLVFSDENNNVYKDNEYKEALQAISSMIGRSEKAFEKFTQGTSQYTLLKNRIKALYIGSSLISKKLAKRDVTDDFSKDDLEKAVAPIASLISKSEKAQKKLEQGTWQYTMLDDNLKALYIVSALLTKA